jgi:tRNA A37 threonylcarbamoyladenosine modification protein TsaB
MQEPPRPLLLALHTTTDQLQIALGSPQFYCLENEQLGREMGKYIHIHLQKIVAEQWTKLAAIAIHSGAGSHTGQRIGAAIAQTISQQLSIPLYQIPHATTALELLQQAWHTHTIAENE